MSKAIKISKGLTINLAGEPEKINIDAAHPESVAIKPTDFSGLTPKLIVKQGDEVQAGSPLFYDKDHPSIQYTSPVSGEVAEIVRGAKRRILEVRVIADKETKYKDFGAADASSLSAEQVSEKLLESGLWPALVQRPFATVANPNDKPKAIFISGLDTNPLSADVDFLLHGQEATFQKGVDAISKLTEGNVNICLDGLPGHSTSVEKVKGNNVVKHSITGPHPAGNVGVQIHHIDPINKGDIVWTISPQHVLLIGRLFATGKYNATKSVAVGGVGSKTPKYYKTIVGASVKSILGGGVKEDREYRIVSGSPLTGEKVGMDGYVGFYDSQVCVLPEGKDPKFFATEGWASPGFAKFSFSRSFPTWIQGKKKQYDIDTNLNGEERAFVITGQYEKVFPFDIYPMQLLKAIMANDIDLMENLGIYEVAAEDFSLCEFICTSKIDIQEIVKDGLASMKAELA